MMLEPQRILERDREKLRLESLLDETGRGRGGVLVVEGAPGIGKSTLLSLLRELADERSLRAPLARGSEAESRLCSGVVAQLLDQVVPPAPEPPRRSTQRGGGKRDPTEFAWFEAVRRRLLESAEGNPLVLVVDDLQWADAQSMRFLVYLARRLEGSPIGLAASIRTREPASRSPLLAALLTDPAVDTVRPRPLTERALQELTVQLVGDDPDDAFVDACHRATGGNPFLVTELLREVAAEEMPPTAETARDLASLGPQAVIRSVLLRVARSGGAAAAVARAAAVLGDAAPMEDVAAVAGLELERAYDAAGALVRSGVLQGEGDVTFDHPILRSAVHADMTSMELAEAHGRAATILQARGAPDDRVAGHLLHALPGRLPDAGGILLRAARLAMEQGDPATAEDALLRALAEPLEAGQRADVLDDLSLAQTRLGKQEATHTSGQAADARPGGEDRLRMRRRQAGALLLSGRTAEAIAALEALAADSEEAGRETVLEIEADRLLAAALDPGHHAAHRARARRHRSLAGDTPAERLVLAAALVYAWLDAEPADVLGDLARRALSDAGQIAEQTIASPRFALAIAAAAETDREDLVRGVADLTVELAETRGSLPALAIALGQRAILNQASGRLAEAEHDGRRSLEIASTSGFPRVVPWVAAALAATLVDRAGHEAAWDLLEDLGLTGGLGAGLAETRLAEVRATVHLEAGRPAEALADAQLVGERSRTAAMGCRRWRGLAALAHHALGDRDAALEHAQAGLDGALAFGAPREVAFALRVAAAVRGGEEEIALLEQAVGVLEGSHDRVEQARAQGALGSALRRANRRADGRVPLWRAHGTARAAGAAVVERWAAVELASTGARPRSHPAGGVDDLTVSERRIAELAAGGHSNRQIATSLFVTVKTVEIHLTSVYRKLGIVSRGELAEALGTHARPSGSAAA